MKKALLFATLILSFVLAANNSQLKADDPPLGKVDPIITEVDTSFRPPLLTVIHEFPDGHREPLLKTRSISQAQAAWLDAVNQLGR